METKLYHIYNRGNHKELICFRKKDYIVLKKMFTHLFDCQRFDLVSLCIMPNHYHLVLGGYKEEISTVMRDIGRNYTTYMNRSYGLVGHLFQGPYKRKVVDNFVYFRVLIEYLRQNPVKLKHDEYKIFEFQENKNLIKYYDFLLSCDKHP